MSAPPKKRPSRKERRLQRQNGEGVAEKLNFTLREVQPLTENQKLTFEAYGKGKHLLLAGSAGTGKSFLSIYLAMSDVLHSEQYKKIIVIRSVVPTRDVGFLPGTNKEKSKVYEAPYYSIFSELFGRGDAYDYLKSTGTVEFMTTSFVRGITLNNAIIVVDEAQSMTWHEISSVFTRIGDNCKVIFSGDTRQNDLHAERDSNGSGFGNFMKVIAKMPEFKTIPFTSADIVRSGLVKSFIITCEKLGY